MCAYRWPQNDAKELFKNGQRYVKSLEGRSGRAKLLARPTPCACHPARGVRNAWIGTCGYIEQRSVRSYGARAQVTD